MARPSCDERWLYTRVQGRGDGRREGGGIAFALRILIIALLASGSVSMCCSILHRAPVVVVLLSLSRLCLASYIVSYRIVSYRTVRVCASESSMVYLPDAS
ncbi:hypothetical protein C8Q77DRAFT_1149504 [Trametes polyzona]|nr:hypothetical protein C8Q77DRAFT_1149504 [Trametes polyzona]